MAKTKQWTPEDREAALAWIAGKARTGVVFRGQDETTEAMVARLTAITDLSDFAAAVQAALTETAWKRLLGALRQRKHQAEDEGQADEVGAQQADAGACASCAALQAKNGELERELKHAISVAADHILTLKAEAESLQQQLASEAKLLAEHMQPIRQANDGDPTALVDWLRQHLFPGSTWYRFASAIKADAGAQDGQGQQQVIDRTQSSSAPAAIERKSEPEPASIDQHTQTVHQVAALALARSHIAAGKTEVEAARAASGKLRNALGCGLGEGGHIAVAPVQRLLQASEGQAITPASKTTRDDVVLLLVKAGQQYKPIARALGIADGTVRNIVKRHQHKAEAA